ncbi:MAG: hypothetical protein KatS3mg095_0538 [Candidatus Parcubacteria bacterium]|nr:MAG: hypothetical protein KatS3mg095_0538 [Candidatus Parcubacteria bacterium]
MPEIFKPEKFLQRKYWKFEDFKEAVRRVAEKKTGKKISKPQPDQIPSYIQRIIYILGKERGKELFKRQILYKRFIIKPEDIPQDYFKNVLLGNLAEKLGYTREDLKNLEIRKVIIEEFRNQTGQDFETYQIPEEEKQQLTLQIIEDQKRSLDTWFDYLTSSEAENYSPEFRYWVFAEVLRCGNYDEKRNEYNERTKTTVATFPELNSQALALLIDELIRKKKQEPSQLIDLNEEQQKEWQKLIQSENFKKLYPWLLEYVNSLKIPKEGLVITEGRWRLFPQNSNHQDLVKAIEGFNTGWCIAGEVTAENYLSHSDIYIYFSKDSKGNYTIPRVAIVFNRNLNKITEIRGIAEGQNLDQYIVPVVEKALTEGLEIEEEKIKLAGSERYLKATKNMKELAEIYSKHLQKQELTSEELRFLYEIDREIIGFGYQKDLRIEEILRGRDYKKDLARIFNCREDQIALTDTKITDETIVLWGNLTSETAQKWTHFPSNLIFVKGYADFQYSQIENLGKLRKIGDDAIFSNSKIKTLSNLEEIGGYVDFTNSQVEDLGKLRRIGNGASFENSKIKTLNNLEEIGGNVYFTNSQVEDLGKLRRIGNYAYFENSKIKTLNNLEEIGWNADFRNSEIEDLGKLRRIGSSAYFSNSKIKTLNNLEEIGGFANFTNSQVKDLGKLRRIGLSVSFENSKIKTLNNLEEIGGFADFRNSEIEDLGKLRRIGNGVSFENSKIKTLNNLEEIGGNAIFRNSQVEDLGNLRRIRFDAIFSNSKIKTLNNLEEIGGDADFRNSEIEDLGKLRRIGSSAYFENSKN